MNECGSSKQQLMTLYKQLNYDVVSNIKLWKDQNLLLYQKISDCCETTNGNLTDIDDILAEYITALIDCCASINGKLVLIREGIEDICIECVHVPVATTTTEESAPETTEEHVYTETEPEYTTGEPGPEECDQPTEFHDKGTFYPYMVEKFVGPDTGMVTLDYDTYDIPDRFIVMFGGVAVIDTGYHGNPIFEPRLNAALALRGVAPVSVNASQVGQASFIKSTAEDHAYVLVYAPLRNTAFNFILSCPGPYTTTTSEEEEVTTTSEEQTPTTTDVEVVTTTSEEQVLTTTGEPCLLDIEVLYPPQPEVTTTSSEVCVYPEDYTIEADLYGYITDPFWDDFTSTLEEACIALDGFNNLGYTIGAKFHAISKRWGVGDYWRVGDYVYDTETCDLVPTGYYIVVVTVSYERIIYIVDGVIVSYPDCPEITTTTSEEPVTTTTSTLEFVTTTSEPPVTTTTTESIPDAFIFEVDVDAETISLPLLATDDDGNAATHNFYVYWDWKNHPETSELITSASANHTYTIPGTYIVVVEGVCHTFATKSKFVGSAHPIAAKIKKVIKWGTVADFRLLNFYGCVNLTDLPHDLAGDPSYNSFGTSDGTIKCAASINTFENFMYGCAQYVHGLNGNMFKECPYVLSFKYSFANCGATGILGSDIFSENILAENFEGTFNRAKFTTAIPYLLFTNNTNALYFGLTFKGSTFSGRLDGRLFMNCPDALMFNETWRDCIYLTELESSLFYYNKKVNTFHAAFMNCTGFSNNGTLGYPVYNGTLFARCTDSATTLSFSYTFASCTNVSQSLPLDMFANNSKVVDFSYTFSDNDGLTGTIPVQLFANCPNVTTFEGTFYNGGASKKTLSEIPANLFLYNTKAYNFKYTFRWQEGILTVPNGLFKTIATHADVLTKTIDFTGTFNLLRNDVTVIEQYPFSNVGQAPALNRFDGRTVKFDGMFYVRQNFGSWANTRYAPELWDVTKYKGTFTGADCFGQFYYQDDLYTNDCEIPTAWGGQNYPCQTSTTTEP